MTLDDYIKKYPTLREMPPLCIFCILTNYKEKIFWIDPDAFRKNSFFIIVNEAQEVINKLSFKEFNKNVDNYLNNGWFNDNDFFINKDIKTWIKDFTNEYGISLE